MHLDELKKELAEHDARGKAIAAKAAQVLPAGTKVQFKGLRGPEFGQVLSVDGEGKVAIDTGKKDETGAVKPTNRMFSSISLA